MTPHDAGSSRARVHAIHADASDGATTATPEQVEAHRQRLEKELGRKVARIVARADLAATASGPRAHVLLTREHYEDLCHRSTIDGKTGLLNYRAFAERLREELGRAARHGEELALMMIDIDGLKDLNDRRGHLVGDRAIRALADVLKGQCRVGDVSARYGGDEFVVVVTHVDEQGATALARRLLEAARGPLAPFGVGISIGLAAWPASADNWRQLIAAADEALYFAKRAGGNRVRLFSSRRESIPA